MALDIVFDKSGNNFNIHLNQAAVQKLQSASQSASSEFNTDLAAAAQQFPDVESVIHEIQWDMRELAAMIDATGRVSIQGTLPKGHLTGWTPDDKYPGFSVVPGGPPNVTLVPAGAPGHPGVQVAGQVPPLDVTVKLPAGALLKFQPQPTYLVSVTNPVTGVITNYDATVSGDGQTLTAPQVDLTQAGLGGNGTYVSLWVAVTADAKAPVGTTQLAFTIGNVASPSTPVNVIASSSLPQTPVITTPKNGSTSGDRPDFTGTVPAPVDQGTYIRATEGSTVIADNIPIKADRTWIFDRAPKAGPWTPGTHTVTVTAVHGADISAPATVTFTVVDPRTPVITTPKNGGTTGDRPDFTGTVPAPVDQGTYIRATEGSTVIADNIPIKADRTWIFDRAPKAGPWTPGTHTVTVTAVHGTNISAPATVTFTVAQG